MIRPQGHAWCPGAGRGVPASHRALGVDAAPLPFCLSSGSQRSWGHPRGSRGAVEAVQATHCYSPSGSAPAGCSSVSMRTWRCAYKPAHPAAELSLSGIPPASQSPQLATREPRPGCWGRFLPPVSPAAPTPPRRVPALQARPLSPRTLTRGWAVPHGAGARVTPAALGPHPTARPTPQHRRRQSRRLGLVALPGPPRGEGQGRAAQAPPGAPRWALPSCHRTGRWAFDGCCCLFAAGPGGGGAGGQRRCSSPLLQTARSPAEVCGAAPLETSLCFTPRPALPLGTFPERSCSLSFGSEQGVVYFSSFEACVTQYSAQKHFIKFFHMA